MVCSKRFWIAPRAERCVDTCCKASPITSIASFALSPVVSTIPAKELFNASIPRLADVIVWILAVILLLDEESAPTCKLNFKSSATFVSVLLTYFPILAEVTAVLPSGSA